MAGAVVGIAVLGGCASAGSQGGPLQLAAPQPNGRVATECSALVAAAPERVAGASRRDVTPPTSYASAWGEPPIVLRCGGPAPSALHRTSQCFVVNGVGWLVTQHGREVDPTRPLTGPLSFTTIGRSVFVDVRVPDAYAPAADALVDLARTIRTHSTVRRPCR